MPPHGSDNMLAGGRRGPSERGGARPALEGGHPCDTLTKWRIGLAALEHAELRRRRAAFPPPSAPTLRRAAPRRRYARRRARPFGRRAPNRDLPLGPPPSSRSRLGRRRAARALLALPARFRHRAASPSRRIFARRYAAAGGSQPWDLLPEPTTRPRRSTSRSRDDADLAGGGRAPGVYGGAVHATSAPRAPRPSIRRRCCAGRASTALILFFAKDLRLRRERSRGFFGAENGPRRRSRRTPRAARFPFDDAPLLRGAGRRATNAGRSILHSAHRSASAARACAAGSLTPRVYLSDALLDTVTCIRWR